MREIVLDVETTGLWPNMHRVIEVACIELDNHKPTGRIFHRYINPLLARMPQEAFDIHGIPIEFLWRHAPFYYITDSLLDFIGSDQLVIHNARFDMAFINSELGLMRRRPLRNQYVDTLAMARKQFPKASNSLDALCRRFHINLDKRKRHGAMVDCVLLANVYFELIGGRQPLMTLPVERPPEIVYMPNARPYRAPRPHAPPTNEERMNFARMLTQMKNPMWRPTPPAELDDSIPF